MTNQILLLVWQRRLHIYLKTNKRKSIVHYTTIKTTADNERQWNVRKLWNYTELIVIKTTQRRIHKITQTRKKITLEILVHWDGRWVMFSWKVIHSKTFSDDRPTPQPKHITENKKGYMLHPSSLFIGGQHVMNKCVEKRVKQIKLHS